MSHKDRVVQERIELGDKINKLEAFMTSESFKLLTATKQSLLKGQMEAMRIYHRILGLRLSHE